MSSVNLTDDRLRDYLDGRLDAAARAEVEEHLADNDAYRSRLVALHLERAEEVVIEPTAEALARARAFGRPRIRPMRWLAAVLATAVLGGVLWNLTQAPPELPADEPVLRFDETPSHIELLSPAEGVVLDRGPIELRWTPVVNAVRYRVWVLDAAGRPLVKERTQETAWALEGGLDAAFWFVEADLQDGSRIESETRQLTLAPLP